MTSLRDRPAAVDGRAADVEVISLLGSFDRSGAAQDEAVHRFIRRFRAGETAAFAQALRAGRDALDRDETLRGSHIAAFAVPGHDGSRQAGLVRLVARLADAGGWSVADPDHLIRHTPVAEAKHRQPRDPAAELASLRATPATLSATIEGIVLVDDVLASGATIGACVAALRRDGWRGRVAALVLARAH